MKLGSADMVQLNHDFEPLLCVLDADWSDLIEISDVTRTVYIGFVAIDVLPCYHFLIIPPSKRRNLRLG